MTLFSVICSTAHQETVEMYPDFIPGSTKDKAQDLTPSANVSK